MKSRTTPLAGAERIIKAMLPFSLEAVKRRDHETETPLISDLCANWNLSGGGTSIQEAAPAGTPLGLGIANSQKGPSRTPGGQDDRPPTR